jgi:hypothetical protein
MKSAFIAFLILLPLTSVIRDELFDEMIGKLSGRRAVLIFDSCHSGTISRGVPKLNDFARGGGVRYLPIPEQFAELEAAPIVARSLTYSSSRWKEISRGSGIWRKTSGVDGDGGANDAAAALKQLEERR